MDRRAQGHRLRRGRFSEPGRIYLVTTVTASRRPYFGDFACGRLVVNALRGEHERALTWAYVVMPDHLHWLVEIRDCAALSQTVRNVKSVSAHRLARRLGSTGPIWQRGFHDHALRRYEDLAQVARYVVANPLRAGLVDRLGEYPLWDAAWL